MNFAPAALKDPPPGAFLTRPQASTSSSEQRGLGPTSGISGCFPTPDLPSIPHPRGVGLWIPLDNSYTLREESGKGLRQG